jgi:BlaI family transcriptional regulator, penicillinase repressor
MDVVYRIDEATAAAIAAALPDPPSYSAVRSLLAILVGKGHLRSEARGNRYVYLPTIPRETARKRALRDVVATFFDGSSKQAVVALLDDAARKLSEGDLEEIRRRIEEAKQQGR